MTAPWVCLPTITLLAAPGPRAMSTERLALPRELLDLILDHVTQEPRHEHLPTILSCSARTFICRTMPATDLQGGISLLSTCGTRVEDSGAIHGGALIRGHHHSQSPSGFRKVVLDAMAKLPNLAHLVIQPAGLRRHHSLIPIDDETTATLLRILDASRLRSLTLYRVKCRVDVLPAIIHLETLSLFHVGFIDAYNLAQRRSRLPQETQRERVRALTCDRFSYEEVNQYLSRMEESWRDDSYDGPGDYTPLRHVKKLRIYFSDSQGIFIPDEDQGKLLQQAVCLSSLSITCNLTEPRILSQDQAPQSPLKGLNASSLITITHLSIRLLVHIDHPHFAIRHPFCGLCKEESLLRLRMLQSFQISLILQGYFDVDQSSFGDQWSQLSDVLTKPNAFAKLKEVGVIVMIRVPPAGDEGSIGPASRRAAENFRNQLSTLVYPAQFQALEGRNAEGMFAFSFEIEISTGPWIYLRDCEVEERERALHRAPHPID
ncbi:hypothetical protein NMY22_g18964 [Coprinellus aureogranulatus]|nr:hypothetical protein NMY22_g18964 [Coprinellus aureogranulatus]